MALSVQSRRRADRLLRLAALLTIGPRTRRQLVDLGVYRDTGNASRQKFERDKAELRAAGVPIVEADDAYRVARTATDAFDDAELELLDRVATVAADPREAAALAAFTAGAEVFPDVDAGRFRVRTNLPAEAAPFAEAIEQHRTVCFTYRPANAPAALRMVEPWALRTRRGHWYVVAHDRDRDAHRHFRLDRVVDPPRDVGEAVVPRPGVVPSDLLPGALASMVMRLTGPRAVFEARRLGAVPEPDHGPDAWRFPALRDEAALGFALRHDAVIEDPVGLDHQRWLRADAVADLHALAPPEVPGELRPARGGGLDPHHLRRLLLLPSWLRARGGVLLGEAALAFDCGPAELAADLDLLASVEVPGHGSALDVTTVPDADPGAELVSYAQVRVPLELPALERGRVRATLGRAAGVVPDLDPGLLRRVEDRLDADHVVVVDPEADGDTFGQLRRAVSERRVVRLQYLARDEEAPEDRSVTPTGLVDLDGYRYVVGFDHDRDAVRSFRLDRMAQVVVGDVDPASRPPSDVTPTYVPVGDEVQVVLRCTHVGSWVLSRLAPTARLDEDDGTVWARLGTDVPRLVVDHVMVGGGEVELVAPPVLRDAVVERARRTEVRPRPM